MLASGSFATKDNLYQACLYPFRSGWNLCILNRDTFRGRVCATSYLYLFLSRAAGLPPEAKASGAPIGPDGGDARAIAAVPGQPSHLYLGTTVSFIYESTDEGASWHRLAKLDSVNDLVMDHIVVNRDDPQTMYAAAWTFDRPDGGLWISHDAGKTWQELPGSAWPIDVCFCAGALRSAHPDRRNPCRACSGQAMPAPTGARSARRKPRDS